VVCEAKKTTRVIGLVLEPYIDVNELKLTVHHGIIIDWFYTQFFPDWTINQAMANPGNQVN
jgi:hypothetical protein